ncbi:hypothetical protein [Paenibacillus popilliae]|uniref:Uncharacterized protein n=1 Tax=Paenibacillus popilliae ATCC 14706 TaxID=1212764 RepID=M9LP29_PAEPP|nr:hypothetical protein [Paenibacillus popilliae]GAC42171.1 hypothetical protein PPOP_1528 [Paenibacillus popilliae ATCC 14706]
MPESEDRRRLEARLSEYLTEGDMEMEEQEEAVRRRLPPRTEIRIQTALDPIIEETKQYRSMAKEIDSRYDEYLKRVKEDKLKDS